MLWIFNVTPIPKGSQSEPKTQKHRRRRRYPYVPTKRTVLRRKELKLHPPALMLLSDLGHDFSLACMQYISPSPSMICRERQGREEPRWTLVAKQTQIKVCHSRRIHLRRRRGHGGGGGIEL